MLYTPVYLVTRIRASNRKNIGRINREISAPSMKISEDTKVGNTWEKRDPIVRGGGCTM